jgi:hypothetical protein
MVGDSLRGLRLLPPLKTGRHAIAEILRYTQKINRSIKTLNIKKTTTCDVGNPGHGYGTGTQNVVGLNQLMRSHFSHIEWACHEMKDK